MVSETDRTRVYAAIDLGASSGRVIAGVVADGKLDLVEVARFPTRSEDDGIFLKWDVVSTFEETLAGLTKVQEICRERGAEFAGIAVDSWGVDYGFLSDGAAKLDDVRHHRKAGVSDDAYAAFATEPSERYSATGVLDQSINTVVQLAARGADGSVPEDAVILFIPDLWVYLLSGSIGTDPTIASTSQILDVRTGDWSKTLLAELGPAAPAMPPVKPSGTRAGATTSEVTERIGATEAVPVFRVAGHDTASAFGFARPSRYGERATGLVSSGTWSVAGIAVEQPVATDEAREAGFTFERGLSGFLMVRNLNGMWLLQESLRTWADEDGQPVDRKALVREANEVPGNVHAFDPADHRLLLPGNMPDRIRMLCREAGQPEPETRVEVVRTILESLAKEYVSAVRTAGRLAGTEIDGMHIVGGGSRNALLCQLTAQFSGLPVLAGPTECTAIGNLAAQMWASGIVESIDAAYDLVDPAVWTPTTYYPTESESTATS